MVLRLSQCDIASDGSLFSSTIPPRADDAINARFGFVWHKSTHPFKGEKVIVLSQFALEGLAVALEGDCLALDRWRGTDDRANPRPYSLGGGIVERATLPDLATFIQTFDLRLREIRIVFLRFLFGHVNLAVIWFKDTVPVKRHQVPKASVRTCPRHQTTLVLNVHSVMVLPLLIEISTLFQDVNKTFNFLSVTRGPRDVLKTKTD